jgi:predicted TPR repeat methyltransferase
MTTPSPPSMDIDQTLRWARECLRGDRLEEAQALYSAVLKAAPEHAEAMHYSGMVMHLQGLHEPALRLVRKSIKRMPKQAWPLNNLANILLRMERNEEALKAFDACLKLDPDHLEALLGSANLMRNRKQIALAEEVCKHAAHIAPQHAPAHLLLAKILLQRAKVNEGMQAYQRAADVHPQDSATKESIALILIAIEAHDHAKQFLREWLGLEPNNAYALHHLAALEGKQSPERASDAYVASVFDGFAESFDQKLAHLEYRAPSLVRQRIEALLPKPQANLQIADLGCGTGLCGPLLQPWAKSIIGCDLSAGMLEQAKAKACYDGLLHQELVAFMLERPKQFDLVISADTLCYFGALEAAIQAAQACMKPGAHLVFTVEALNNDAPVDFALQPNGRYAHRLDYLERLFRSAAWSELKIEFVTLRTERSRQVQGWLLSASLLD